MVLNLNKDDDTNKTLVAKLNFEPQAVSGLGLGAGLYRGKVHGYSEAGGTAPTLSINQTIYSTHLYYNQLPFKFMGELFIFDTADLLNNSAKSSSKGFFVQAAYEIREMFRPYARIEQVSPDEEDPYATLLFGNEDAKRFTAGIRFNISPESSLKFELISEKIGALDRISILGGQWAVVF